MIRSNFWLLVYLAILSGCTVGPKYIPPEVDVPAQWHSSKTYEMTHENPDCFNWWESLNDPILNELMHKASQQNLDLFIAGTRILEARLGRKGSEAELYPHLDGSLTTGHLYWSKDLQRKLFGNCCSHSKHKHRCRRNVNFFEIGFDATWEIDLFGYHKHEINAADARLESSEENLRDVWVSLSAEIARNYIELRGLQQKKKLVLRNIGAQEETVKLIEELVEIGPSSSIDLLQAKEQSVLLAANAPLLDLAIEKAMHRLAVLLGQAPGELCLDLNYPQNLPHMPCSKPIGLPSDLLRRRPDIRRAERNLAAATESVGSAVANLFPRFSIFGFVGEISSRLKSLTNGNGLTWFAAPQLLFPIFNSRLLKQDVQANQILARQALFEYQKAVLVALEEVEDGIASFRYETEHHAYLNQAFEIDKEAYRLNFELYQKGIKDYLSVLAIQRTLLAVEEAILQSEIDLLLHYAALYKALGGGWEYSCALGKD